MVDSTLVVTGFETVTFRADERYTLSWSAWKAKKAAYPSGKGIFGWGQHSISMVTNQGWLITDGGEGSADLQLHTGLLPLARTSQKTALPAIFTMQTGNGPSIYTGWVENFTATRDSPEGIVLIYITFNFFLKEFPNITGLT